MLAVILSCLCMSSFHFKETWHCTWRTREYTWEKPSGTCDACDVCVKSPLCFNHRVHEILAILVPASLVGISYRRFKGNLPLELNFQTCFHSFTAFLNDCLSEPLNACEDGKSFWVHQEGERAIPKSAFIIWPSEAIKNSWKKILKMTGRQHANQR